MALYDYEQIFAHRAPEALRFKLEANLGLADDSDPRLLASINFFCPLLSGPVQDGGFPSLC